MNHSSWLSRPPSCHRRALSTLRMLQIRTQQLKLRKGKRTLSKGVKLSYATAAPLKSHKSPIAYCIPRALVKNCHIAHHASHIITKEAEHHNDPD